jgi:hypothetical protein
MRRIMGSIDSQVPYHIPDCRRALSRSLVGPASEAAELIFIKSVYFEIISYRSIIGARTRRGAVMPILLWYFPFTMFCSGFDLAFRKGETQTGSERQADAAEPVRDTYDLTYDRFGSD